MSRSSATSTRSPAAATPLAYVIPEVKVEDQYVAALNEEGLPQLANFSHVYRRLLDKTGAGGGEQNDETRAYVSGALWLIKSVDQRQKTIHKVATSIINFQREFLDLPGIDIEAARDATSPTTLACTNDVSRVVNDGYMHTPQGVFELKYFFHRPGSYGESVSSVTI